MDAPSDTGLLVKSIGLKALRGGAITIGLKKNFFYKSLDMHTESGPPRAPWFEDSLDRRTPAALREMVSGTKEALYTEAGKAYSRSKSSLGRKG